jgi:hypothetical protein
MATTTADRRHVESVIEPHGDRALMPARLKAPVLPLVAQRRRVETTSTSSTRHQAEMLC